MPLTLTSNLGRPSLERVGDVSLDQETSKVRVKCEVGCRALLERDGNKVVLANPLDKAAVVSGYAKVGDVYTIERGLEKIIITVEYKENEVNHQIYVNANSLNDSVDQKRKTALTAGVIILALLVVSVIFGVNQKRTKEFEQASLVKLAEARQEYELAVSGSVDKQESKKSFMNSKTITLELSGSGFKNSELDQLIEKIKAIEAEMLGEIKVELKEYLDLTLQTSGFNGDEMASSGQEIFILDKNNKNIIRVEIKTKNARSVANGDILSGIKKLGSYENRFFVEKDDGIYEIKSGALEKRLEKDWQDILFYLYAGNIYTVGRDDNQINRYVGSQNSFLSKSSWLAPGIDMDLSKITDMAIDGSIWLSSSSGKITKFTLGNPQTMSLNGISDPLVSPTAIYTNEKLKHVYLLERDKGRVVVMEKNGNFKIQYINEEIKNSKDLVVSEDEGKVILLTGSKLLYFEP